ncbi:unnamed protein product [Tetraodon nigroviridis]|nr:unnamed protein product [Tetraodon nigroviridis]
MKKEHLKPSNCDLKISNDRDEEYTDETTRLEKYSCVIIRRIPARVLVHNPKNAPRKARTCNANSLLVRAETGDDGATLTSTGRCVKSADKGWNEQENKDPAVPDELKCVICKLLMVNAAIVPCCGYSFCDNCIRTVLLESEEHICVACQETVSPDSIVPNLALRRAVANYESIIHQGWEDRA